jgi:hypothetical protein
MGVSAEYFAVFDIRILRGRAFTPAEAARADSARGGQQSDGGGNCGRGSIRWGRHSTSPTAPRGVPTGRSHVVASRSSAWQRMWPTVRRPRGSDASCVYFPIDARGAEDMTILVRARSDDAEGLRTAVTAAVNDAATEAPFQLMSMQSVVDGVAWVFRAFSVNRVAARVVGLFFAYSGTHAVVSFLVAQRNASSASAWRSAPAPRASSWRW